MMQCFAILARESESSHSLVILSDFFVDNVVFNFTEHCVLRPDLVLVDVCVCTGRLVVQTVLVGQDRHIVG